MSGIVKIEVITGMSKLTDLIQNLSKVGVRGRYLARSEKSG